ncbi:MAG: endonuclease MutS2 [Candidatus Gastranaerophilales bacterium]|nr:endonuclease MutS2 [Candidatus Gastranaerophilales bacterium]
MEIAQKSLKTLEFDKVLEKLALHARLEQSRNLCLSLKIYSGTNINLQLQFTKEAKEILDKALELPLEYVASIEEITKSTIESYLSEEEILDVAKTIRTSRLVKNFLKENALVDGVLNSLAIRLFSDKELEDKIFDTFDNELKVKQDATPELKSLFKSLKDTEKNLKERVNGLLNSPEFLKHLQEQIYTIRDERIVFQVRASSKSKVDGIMHDVSASNQTFYIEPKQIIPLNNKIREVKIKIQAEIINILTDLTKLIRKNIEEIIICEKLLAEIDFHFAKARYAVKIKAIEPELIGEKYIKTENMRHPLLIDCVENIIENSFEIGKNYKSIILTGSNTGGKTVAIKTIGLFVLMTEAGLFLPCTEAKIFPFGKIFADIGDEQSIAQSLSTFSSHMTNIIDILKNGDEDTFAVIDEICAGTDPQEGSILARVILEELALKGVTSCVSTHYGELKALEFSNDYFKNACVEFDTKTLKPTYKLIIGIPGLSNAISISANLGLDERLTQKAKDILVLQKDSSIVVVEKLQETQQKLAQNLERAEILKEEAEVLKGEYDKNLSELKKEKKKTVKNAKNSLNTELDEAKDEIKEILKELRQEKSEKIARRSYARLAELEKRVRDKLSKFDENENYEEPDWEKLKSGGKVLLKGLNQPVVILSMPDKNDNVSVQMGLLKTKIKKDKLAAYNDKIVPRPSFRLKSEKSFELEKHDMSNTLDLRGLRVEEALDGLEFFLDKASLVNLTPIYVIHGHGTGALKKAVREFLSTSPYVAKYRFGEAAEGGDGVSIVDIV